MSRQHTLHTPWYRRPAAQIAATALAAGLLGAGGEHFVVHDEPTGHAEHAEQVRTVVPDGCLAALDGVDRALEWSIMFGQSMMDMSNSDGGMHSFQREGSHYEDSRRFHAAMTEYAQKFRDHKTNCRG